VAAIAAPAQLALYTTDPAALRRFGDLLPADVGADVVLLRPGDPDQLERSRSVREVTHVGFSQVVLDCLGGNGRLPEEGRALLGWMSEHEGEWRLPPLRPSEGPSS
jgi:hypothetical protein